jgi:hypothetical protein
MGAGGRGGDGGAIGPQGRRRWRQTVEEDLPGGGIHLETTHGVEGNRRAVKGQGAPFVETLAGSRIGVSVVKTGPAVPRVNVGCGDGPGNRNAETHLGMVRVVRGGSGEGRVRRVIGRGKDAGGLHLISGGETPSGQVGHEVIVDTVALEHVVPFLALGPFGDQGGGFNGVVIRAQRRDIGVLTAVGIGENEIGR